MAQTVIDPNNKTLFIKVMVQKNRIYHPHNMRKMCAVFNNLNSKIAFSVFSSELSSECYRFIFVSRSFIRLQKLALVPEVDEVFFVLPCSLE